MGFEIYKDYSGLYLSQQQYIFEILERGNMSLCNPYFTLIALSTKLSTTEGKRFFNPTLYRSIEIFFIINKPSQYLSNLLEQHYNACKRVLRYIKGMSSLGLTFRSSLQPLSFHDFSDSDWARSPDDRKSNTRSCVFLRGNLIF